MRSSEPIVYVLSTEPTGCEELTGLFVSQGIDTIPLRTTDEFLSVARDDRTACLILDLSLSNVAAFELQSELDHRGAPPIIFLTADADIDVAVHAIRNGAIDFLTKPIDHVQLLAAVDLAFTRDRKSCLERMERTSLLMLWKTLTPREKEVFHHTVAGLLNKQAAAELGVAENTYQVHRGRVMRKMKANSLAHLVRMSTRLEPILGADHDRKISMQSRWSLAASLQHGPCS
jgi:FixJ family two-component response regulator